MARAAGNSVDVENYGRGPRIATWVRVVPAMNMGLSSQETMSSLELRLNRKREPLGREGSIWRHGCVLVIQNLGDSYSIYQCFTDTNDLSLRALERSMSYSIMRRLFFS